MTPAPLPNPNTFDANRYESIKGELQDTVQSLWESGADGDKIRMAFEQTLRQVTGKAVHVEMQLA